MAAKKAAKRKVHRKVRPAVPGARERLASTWDEAREALGEGRARLEKQARALLVARGVDTRKAGVRLAALRRQLEKERRRTVEGVAERLQVLRQRAGQERRALVHGFDQTLRKALAALDLPSRREIAALTRRVEQLSRRIEGLAPKAVRPRRKKAAARR